jgi:hypothetical protein
MSGIAMAAFMTSQEEAGTPVLPPDDILVIAVKIDAPARATLTFNTNGTWIGQDQDDVTYASGTWLVAGTASDYEIRLTTQSGTLSTGTADTWLSLGSQQSWSTYRDTVGLNLYEGDKLEIRMAASPFTVMATCEYVYLYSYRG